MIRFDNLPPEVMQAMCTPMHQVLAPVPIPVYGQPNASHPAYTGALYIGSMSAIHDRDLLLEHRITHLVQVLDVPWLPTNQESGVPYPGGGPRKMDCYRIDILDHSTADLKPHLEAACNYIDKALRTGYSVLVHCQQGISRSAAVTIAYLIRNQGMSYEAAHSLVKFKRPCIKPNPGFVKALKEWESLWVGQGQNQQYGGNRPGMARRFTT